MNGLWIWPSSETKLSVTDRLQGVSDDRPDADPVSATAHAGPTATTASCISPAQGPRILSEIPTPNTSPGR